MGLYCSTCKTLLSMETGYECEPCIEEEMERARDIATVVMLRHSKNDHYVQLIKIMANEPFYTVELEYEYGAKMKSFDRDLKGLKEAVAVYEEWQEWIK